MRRILFLLISIAFYCVRFPLLWLIWLFNRNCVLNKNMVLMYHEIKKEEQAIFGWQLDVVAKKYPPIEFDEMSTAEYGRRFFAITFDDAFVCFKKYVLPELQKRGLKAAVFVPSGLIGQKPQWDADAEDRLDGERIMDEEDIKSLVKYGVEIGAHTVNHVALSGCGKEQVESEIVNSKADLETLLQNKVRFFAFPFGSISEDAIALAKVAGYEKAFSVIAPDAFVKSNTFLVGRIRVSPQDWPLEFHLKVAGAYNWHAQACRLKSRLIKFIRR